VPFFQTKSMADFLKNLLLSPIKTTYICHTSQ